METWFSAKEILACLEHSDLPMVLVVSVFMVLSSNSHSHFFFFSSFLGIKQEHYPLQKI